MYSSPQHSIPHLSQQDLLYGFDKTEGIIGAYLHPSDDSSIMLFRRVEGAITGEAVTFFPFFHLTDRALLHSFQRKHWIKELDGPGDYKYLSAFPSWNILWEAIRHIAQEYQKRSEKRFYLSAQHPVLMKLHPACQYFLQSGRTSFKGMLFSDMHRLQIALALHSTHGYSNAQRASDRILAIALADNRGWEKILYAKKKSEKALLQEFIDAIQERDPDVIEGDNLLSFELPYLLTRCSMQEVEPKLGRMEVHAVASGSTSGAEPLDEKVREVFGRHLVDMSMLLQTDEVTVHDASSSRLHNAALRLGFAASDEIYIPSQKNLWYFENDPELLIKHLQHTTRKIALVSTHYSQAHFAQASMIPMNYDGICQTGSSEKIELLMMREYIRRRFALPLPESGSQTTGAYTDIFYTGIFSPILHVDIESMYPSIMIQRILAPSRDMLGTFLQLLEGLTAYRLEAKHRMTRETDAETKHAVHALQYSFKILINSFYGYLGYPRALFNDYRVADTVVSLGQEIIRSLVGSIRKAGGIPIEADTDGVFFVPPPGILGEEKEQEFVAHLNSDVPEGIRLSAAVRYQKMLSYKMKNYALIDASERLILRGSSFFSRTMERFVRRYIESCIDCLIREDIAGLHELYINLIYDFTQRRMHIRDFMKVETIRQAVDEEEIEQAIRTGAKLQYSAHVGAMIRAGRKANVGDRVAYYHAGFDPSAKAYHTSKLAEMWDATAPDENIAYYIRRIDEISERFQIFFTEHDFTQIFSSEDSLFPFDPSRITIISRMTEPTEKSAYAIEWDSSFESETES